MKPADTEIKDEDEIFPLPLTGMEKFHLASDSPSFPNTIFGRLRFEGQLDQSLTRTTLKHLLRRHLLIGKTVTKIGKRLHWAIDAAPSSEIKLDGIESDGIKPDEIKLDGTNATEAAVDRILTWQRDVDFSAPDQIQLADLRGLKLHANHPTQIDINYHHGLHIWVLVGENQTTILSALHHASGDGAGGVQFLSDFCQVYDNLNADRDWDHSLRKLAPTRLLDRGRLGLLKWDYLRHLWKQPIAVLGMVKFLRRTFRVFQPNELTLQPTTNLPGIVGRWIDDDHSQSIQSFADQNNVRVNSVVMAAVFQASESWAHRSVTSAENGPPEDNDTGQRRTEKNWIRMLLPISYRSKSDLRLPMTNKATLVQVDRNAEQMQNEQSFLFYLNREIDIVMGWQFDKIFLMSVNVMARFPRWIKSVASDREAKGTIVFTNLGEPFRLKHAFRPDFVGPLRWVDFDLVGPVRSKMPINFTLQRHKSAGRIRYRLSLHFDRRVIDEDQAHQFLASIDRSIREMIHGPEGAEGAETVI